MQDIPELLARATALGVLPSLVIKSALGYEALLCLAPVKGLVLQGGAALHHIYGSPRFSADLDFVHGQPLPDSALTDALQDVATRVREPWGPCEVLAPTRRGRLRRAKLRLSLREGTALVLAIECYEAPAHRVEPKMLRGAQAPLMVEAPVEILTDKLAATVDRWTVRGSFKLRDVFDLDFLADRARPEAELLRVKLLDYGLAPDPSPLGAAARSLDALAVEAFEAQLRGVLPPGLPLQPPQLIARIRGMFEEVAGWKL